MFGLASPTGGRTSSPGRERPFRKLPQILCGFFIFLYTLFFIYRAGVALFYSYPLQYGEGAVFYEAGQLYAASFSPANLYPANLAPPYQAGIYTPLFYYLQAVTMFVTGPNSIVGGRLITLLASFWVGFTLYRVAGFTELAAGRRGRLGICLAAALTPFATAALYDWGVLAKADILAIAFSMTAVWRVWRGDQSRRVEDKPGLVWAGILCALALLTKQSALAAPAAIIIWLGLERRWRDLGAFLGALLALLGIVTLVFQLTTNGNFLRHVISYNAQPYDFGFLGAALNYLVWTHIVLLVLAASWIARPIWGRYEKIDLWRYYTLTALAVSFSAGKIGSDYNYYIESIGLLSLLAWCQIGRLLALRSIWRLGPLRIPVALVALGFMVVQLFQLHHIPVIADGSDTPGSADFETAKQVADQLEARRGQGPILAEDSGWLRVQGIDTDLDDPFVFGQLAQDGTWDNRSFMEKLTAGYYRTILYEISQPDMSEAALEQAFQANSTAPFPRRFSPEMLKVLEDRSKFIPLRRIGRWVFLIGVGERTD